MRKRLAGLLALLLMLCLCACEKTYSIKVVGGEDLVISCPKAARAGETVTVEAKSVTDGWLEMKASGADVETVQESVFRFTMPAQNVEIRILFVWDDSCEA